MFKPIFLSLIFVCLTGALAAPVHADLFGSGENIFEIEFVKIGAPGNPPDSPSVVGTVAYPYRMAKYEISESMIDAANALGDLGITKDTRGPDKPATSISWFEAARFVNWLNTSTGHTPAYKFDGKNEFQLWEPADLGYDPDNVYRNRRAFYFLPSVDEWHKAAYYDPVAGVYYDYPTGSDMVPDGIDFPGDPEFEAVFFDGAGNPGPNNTNPGPNDVTNVGLLGHFGTAGQGGNVSEWEETSINHQNDSAMASRGFRGGAWGNITTHLLASNRNGIGPHFEADFFGFRVASIPEPQSLMLLCLGIGCLWLCRSWRS